MIYRIDRSIPSDRVESDGETGLQHNYDFNKTQPVIHVVGYHQLTLLIRYNRSVTNQNIVTDENFPRPDIKQLCNGEIFHKKIN